MEEDLGMKKKLGKKASMQDGTLVAFSSCSCDSSCRMLGCSCTSKTAASNTLNLQNYSKLLSKAITGTWAF
jgi:putative bacteriocin precursor